MYIIPLCNMIILESCGMYLYDKFVCLVYYDSVV